jgi:hypothetical protein
MKQPEERDDKTEESDSDDNEDETTLENQIRDGLDDSTSVSGSVEQGQDDQEERDQYSPYWFVKVQDLLKLPEDDPERINIIKPTISTRVLDLEGARHIRVAKYFGLVLDMIAVQRSQASVLPVANGQRGIELRGLFQKMRYQTASFGFTPEERTEYELYHKLAAEYDSISFCAQDFHVLIIFLLS